MVALAANGQEALACLREGPEPDLILLHLLTPLLDGWQFLKQHQQAQADTLAPTPVVILTGIASACPEWSASLGAAGFLRKPIETEALLQEVGRCVRKGQPLGLRSATP